MDELAAAAAVVAMSIDDEGVADVDLEGAPGAAAGAAAPTATLEATDADKENEGVPPEVGNSEATARKVMFRS
jgi:hypothetical protein